MFYLVTQRTEKGMEEAKVIAEKKVYGTMQTPHFTPKIWNRVMKVTSEVFESPELIRAWFKKNREKFYNGDSPEWDVWFNGEDSSETTIGKTETHRFWFMDVEEFNALEVEQNKGL